MYRLALPMNARVSRVPLDEIVDLRELYRSEMACQIVHDSLHRRGFTACYAIRLDDRPAGYGCLLGFGEEPKDTVVEFYVLPAHRTVAPALFDALVDAGRATAIQAQTNDPLLSLMLFDRAGAISRVKILFEDGFRSNLTCPDATFRATTPEDRDRTFHDRPEDVGDWHLGTGDGIVATGGILSHYNPPYGDLYMEVAPDRRRRGYGSYLVQELKRTCYELGKVPAARCDPENRASRATLQRAGMLPCGMILTGRIRDE